MKKAKSSSSAKRRERSRSPADGSRSKRIKPRSRSKEREKIKDETKSGPRKTRWQAADSENVAKTAQSGPPPRIRDLLHDKERIVDLLFQTVTGAALDELIPDYLKNRSKEDLTRLCLEQIKDMTDEEILQIISGKVDSSNKDEEKNVKKEQILKLEQPNIAEEKEEKVEVTATKKEPLVVPGGELSGDVPKPPSCKDVERSEEENVIPLVIKDEIAKDLILPERDAELLELEMRARAIRSLLKSKAQSTREEEMKD